jgi:hypothetical protein
MEALFMKADGSTGVAGRATWIGPHVRLEADDSEVRSALGRVFRPTPVVVDDPSLRTAGTSGAVQLPPGTLMWFREAARVRGEQEGFKVVFVPGGESGAGWDPAGSYRPFAAQVERMERVPSEAMPREQPGGAKPEGEPS